MAKKHLKRIAAPKTWQIERKKTKWITRPNPGAHPLGHSMALCTVLTDLIKCAKTKGEIKKLLVYKKIIVDGKRRKEPKYPVGLMDVIEIPETGECYRVLLNKKGKITVKAIEKGEADIKLCKIINKTLAKGGKTQLNLSDGRNILIKDDNYKTGDVVVMKTQKQEIKSHLKLEKNVTAYLTGGKHIGEHGIIEDIKDNNIIFKSKDGERYETLKEYAFVIGKDKPTISLLE